MNFFYRIFLITLIFSLQASIKAVYDDEAGYMPEEDTTHDILQRIEKKIGETKKAEDTEKNTIVENNQPKIPTEIPPKNTLTTKPSIIKQIREAVKNNNHEEKIKLIQGNLKQFDPAFAETTKDDDHETAKKIICDKEIAEAGIINYHNSWVNTALVVGTAGALGFFAFGIWVGKVLYKTAGATP